MAWSKLASHRRLSRPSPASSSICAARGVAAWAAASWCARWRSCVADVGPCADERGQPPVVRHPAHHDYGLVFAAGKDEVGYA
jgi:hypothetical protein